MLHSLDFNYYTFSGVDAVENTADRMGLDELGRIQNKSVDAAHTSAPATNNY
jgi:hypothetical protein